MNHWCMKQILHLVPSKNLYLYLLLLYQFTFAKNRPKSDISGVLGPIHYITSKALWPSVKHVLGVLEWSYVVSEKPFFLLQKIEFGSGWPPPPPGLGNHQIFFVKPSLIRNISYKKAEQFTKGKWNWWHSLKVSALSSCSLESPAYLEWKLYLRRVKPISLFKKSESDLAFSKNNLNFSSWPQHLL